MGPEAHLVKFIKFIKPVNQTRIRDASGSLGRRSEPAAPHDAQRAFALADADEAEALAVLQRGRDPDAEPVDDVHRAEADSIVQKRRASAAFPEPGGEAKKCGRIAVNSVRYSSSTTLITHLTAMFHFCSSAKSLNQSQ